MDWDADLGILHKKTETEKPGQSILSNIVYRRVCSYFTNETRMLFVFSISNVTLGLAQNAVTLALWRGVLRLLPYQTWRKPKVSKKYDLRIYIFCLFLKCIPVYVFELVLFDHCCCCFLIWLVYMFYVCFRCFQILWFLKTKLFI